MSSVSVFIPCYRYAHYLRGCVRSVLRQRDVDVRVLILDDASPDNTPDVARSLVKEDARVEYHRNPQNLGHIATYNIGIQWASGQYVLLLSADDMLVPGALARAARVMDVHPEVVLTYGKEVRATEFGFDSVADAKDYDFRVMSGGEFWHASAARAANIVPTPTAVVRTTTHKQVGGYLKELPHAGDLEMWLRLAAHGSVAVIDVPQGFYRVHGNNMSVDFAGLRDLQQKKAAFETAALQFAGRLPELPQLLKHVDRLLAQQAFWTASGLFDRGEGDQSRRCIDFAASLWPELYSWGPWRRFRLKQLVGPNVWGACRPVLNWARRKRAVVA